MTTWNAFYQLLLDITIRSAVFIIGSLVSPVWQLLEWAFKPYVNLTLVQTGNVAAVQELLRFTVTLQSNPTIAKAILPSLFLCLLVQVLYLLAFGFLGTYVVKNVRAFLAKKPSNFSSVP